MNVWFSRANGKTLHNNPSSPLFVQGEPPRFPDTEFKHASICALEGFARIGWPAAGDLRTSGWEDRARAAYGKKAGARELGYLRAFASIMPGDLVLVPVAATRWVVYLGLVLPAPSAGEDIPAYHHHFDVKRNDWFENSHRIAVRWARDRAGRIAKIDIPELGGVWRQPFSAVDAARDDAIRIAAESGLIIGAD